MRGALLGGVCLVTAYFFGCSSNGSNSQATGGVAGSEVGGSGGSPFGGSSNGGDSGAGAVGQGGSAASGQGGTAAVGGTSNQDADVPDVVFNYDAGIEDSSVNQDSACAATTVEANPVPLDMYIMQDKSGSMGSDCNVGSTTTSKWCYAINALYGFFSAPSSTGMGVALEFFTSACSGYDVPAVALGLLPGNLAALQSALNSNSPTGTTGMSAACQGLATYTAANKQPGREMIGILITDGSPVGCDTNLNNINAILVNHFNATGIPTFVIGMTGANFGYLETIGQNAGVPSHTNYCGGVNPCVSYDVKNGDPSVFIAALKTIQQTAVGCQYQLPTTDAGLIDPAKVNVEYTPSGGTPTQLGRVNDAGSCGPQGGWYYDNNANPTTIILCPATCALVQSDPNPKVEILLGCQGS
jgi:hypothetical protein